jgi:GTP-binding protein
VKISEAKWVAGAATPGRFPAPGLAEIAFAGRSNVGKSSLLNCLVNRKALARVGNTPGKTRQVNFFLVNRSFYLVDLPGYGYARIAKEARQNFARLVEPYLYGRKNLRLVVLLVDIRHRPSADDTTMYKWLTSFQVPAVIVAAKADKITRGRWPAALRQIREGLGLGAEGPVIPFSARTGAGKDALWHIIAQYMNGMEDTSLP